jgi:hypothetical protein
MKIEQLPAVYASRKVRVTLENDKERALTDDQLITLCDNLEGIEYNYQTKSYSLTGEPLGTPHHFGGRVDRQGDVCTVKVHID